MICPFCAEIGWVSKVYPEGCSQKLLGGNPEFYDEEGKYHYHDRAVVERQFRCSNGHRWLVVWQERCTNPLCGWPNEEPEIRQLEGRRAHQDEG